jgi:hypothetical protein
MPEQHSEKSNHNNPKDKTPRVAIKGLVVAAGSSIKAGASQRPMRIVRLAAPIAPGNATEEQSPPGYSYGRGLDGQPFWRQCVCQHLEPKDGFKKSLSMSGEVSPLAGDRVVSHERSRPLALLMKLGVALAQPVQSRFDPHHLSASLSALWKRRSWKARSVKSCAILRPADFSPASRKSTLAAALWLAARRTTIAIH